MFERQLMIEGYMVSGCFSSYPRLRPLTQQGAICFSLSTPLSQLELEFASA